MDADHQLKMNLLRREIRPILLHEFRLGHKATEAANNICSTVGEDLLSIRTAQHCFNQFNNGNIQLDGLPRPSRPPKVECGSLKAAYRTRSSIDFTVFSRAAWVLSYCGRKTSERIR